MAGDFPNLSSNITTQWPKQSGKPPKREWLPAYSISLVALSTIFLSARLWSHWRRPPGRLKIDDALACGAWAFSILFTATCVIGTTKYGFDRHIWDAHPDTYGHAALIQWLSEGAFLFSTCMTKVSVLLFYQRLDTTAYTRTVKRVIHVLIALTGVYLLGSVLFLVFLCQPVSAYWHSIDLPSAPPPSCHSQRVSYPIEGALCTLVTIYSIAIPYFVLRYVPMSKNHRLGLCIVVSAGLSVVCAGIARTVLLSKLSSSTNGDATWNGFNVFVASQLECQLAIICASFPFLQPYVLPNPRLPIVYVSPEAVKERHDSVLSRVSSSVSGRIRWPHPLRQNSLRQVVEIPVHQAGQIPEWEFETLASASGMTPSSPLKPQSPLRPSSPLDIECYDRYLAGQYGPPPPPKDSRDLFDKYRRDRHGGWV